MKHNRFFALISILLLAGVSFAATSTRQVAAGKKARVSGRIIARERDTVTVQEKHDTAIVNVSDSTKIGRLNGTDRRAALDVALLPGLKIKASGVGNSDGQLDACKISRDQDMYRIALAQEQQINGTQRAVAQAQTTADSGVTQARAAQSSANEAKSAADEAGKAAEAAGEMSVENGAKIAVVNQRINDLDNFKTVAEVAIRFRSGHAALDAAAKAELDELAAKALSSDNYVIEVAGYASSTGTKTHNQVLSDRRAAAVVEYLRNEKDVPQRNILTPAGYGSTHFVAENSDRAGRSQNQRVSVKLLINRGLHENAQATAAAQ